MAASVDKIENKLTEKDFGCDHYRRNCALVSPCCGKVYTCRLCHNDEEMHEIDRHSVKEVKCLMCNKQQEVKQKCCECDALFGTYFCSVCNMFDNVNKDQFHCDGCGICRVGGRDKFFHCEKCDMCLDNNLRGNHKCIEKVSHANCPVCMEDLHTSRERGHIPSCGHLLHRQCYKDLLNTGNFACPLCGESMVIMEKAWEYLDNEIASTPMPEEYKDYRISVLCKDCHKETEVVFHVVGNKCGHCGSYNTRKVGDVTQPPCYTEDGSGDYSDDDDDVNVET